MFRGVDRTQFFSQLSGGKNLLKFFLVISEKTFWIGSVLVGQSYLIDYGHSVFLIGRLEKKCDMLKNKKYINKANIDWDMLGNF